MPRAIRSVFLIASFTLCVLFIYLWIRSLRICEEAEHVTRSPPDVPVRDVLYGFGSANGHLYAGFLVTKKTSEKFRPQAGWRYTSALGPLPSWSNRFEFLGLEYWNVATARGWHAGLLHARGLALPYWLLVLAFAIWPAVHARAAYRCRRAIKRRCFGLCSNCGYDLRHSQGPCPECGAARVPVA